MVNNNNNNIEIIMWAFTKGYRLGHSDNEEGIHIDFSEIQKYFLSELTELHTLKNNKMCIVV